MKICRTCKQEKEITEFKRNSMYKDGFETQCKQCQKDKKLSKLEENKNNIPEFKICRVCNEEKHILEFGINRTYKDGYDTQCKICRNKKAAIQRDKHREKSNKKYVEKYHSDLDFKQHRLDTSKKVREKLKREHPEKIMLYSAKQRAKEKGWEFNLEESDIIIPDKCPILEIDLLPGGVGKQTFNSPSIDRIDSTKGYIKGNIKVISLRANMMKNDASLEELQKFKQNIINYINNEDIVRPIEN